MAEAQDEKQELQKRLTQDVGMRVGILVLVIALGGFIAWAVFVPLTEGVVATGSVVVDTAHKTIQHLEGGIVDKLYVHEGSKVKQGDVLIELSDTQSRAELELLEGRYYSQLAEVDRLNAERLLREELSFSSDLLERQDDPRIIDILMVQKDLFEVRRRQYHGQIDILRHRVDQLKERIRGLEASRGARQREQELIKKDLESLRNLRKQQLIEESLLIARQREYEQGVGELGNAAAEIAATKVAIGETQQEIIQLEHDLRTEVSGRMTEVQQALFETRERIASVSDVLRRTRIEAPQDGKVIGLTAHTLGGVIPPGSPIMNIVPSEERLMVEGQVRPTDVDNVHSGQQARLRFSAFTFRTTPEVFGQVERVSPDAFQNEETGEAYYIARILVTDKELQKLGKEKLEPGMPVEIMFTGGESTAMQYLSEPILGIIRKALVEE